MQDATLTVYGFGLRVYMVYAGGVSVLVFFRGLFFLMVMHDYAICHYTINIQ